MAPSCYLSAKSPSRFHDVCPHCGYSRSPTGGGVFCVSADVTLVVTPCLVAPGRDELTDHLLGLLFTSTFSGFTKAALVSAHSCSPLSVPHHTAGLYFVYPSVSCCTLGFPSAVGDTVIWCTVLVWTCVSISLGLRRQGWQLRFWCFEELQIVLHGKAEAAASLLRVGRVLTLPCLFLGRFLTIHGLCCL